MSGCSSTEEMEEGIQAGNGSPVAFRATTNLSETTRAGVMDLSNLKDFRVYATYDSNDAEDAATSTSFMEAVNVTRTVGGTGSTDFTYAPAKYWPAGDHTVLMYAYTPAGSVNVASATAASTSVATNDAGNIAINYVVPLNDLAKRQEDFMVASQSVLKSAQKNAVSLVFKHVLTKMTFSATNKVGEGVNFNISKVELVNFRNSGTYTVAYEKAGTCTGTWTSTQTNADQTYSATLPVGGISVPFMNGGTAVNLMPNNEGMMFLPQTTTATTSTLADIKAGNGDGGSYLKLTFSAMDGSASEIYPEGSEKYYRLGQTFDAGKNYNIHITFAAGGSGSGSGGGEGGEGGSTGGSGGDPGTGGGSGEGGSEIGGGSGDDDSLYNVSFNVSEVASWTGSDVNL